MTEFAHSIRFTPNPNRIHKVRIGKNSIWNSAKNLAKPPTTSARKKKTESLQTWINYIILPTICLTNCYSMDVNDEFFSLHSRNDFSSIKRIWCRLLAKNKMIIIIVVQIFATDEYWRGTNDSAKRTRFTYDRYGPRVIIIILDKLLFLLIFLDSKAILLQTSNIFVFHIDFHCSVHSIVVEVRHRQQVIKYSFFLCAFSRFCFISYSWLAVNFDEMDSI